MADRPPLADLAALVKKIGYTPSGAEATRATDVLCEASELIRDEADLTWLNADESAVVDVPPRIERICIAVAYRGFDNARALLQKTMGDASQTWDRTGVGGGEGVYLTDAEKRAVVKAAGGTGFTAVTMVSPYSGDLVDDAFLVSLDTP